jgi:hypothetical protein
MIARVIHNDEELEAYTAALFELTVLGASVSAGTRSHRAADPADRAVRTGALRYPRCRRDFRCALPDGTAGPHPARPDFAIRIGERRFDVPVRATQAYPGAGAEAQRPLQAACGCFYWKDIENLPVVLPTSPGSQSSIQAFADRSLACRSSSHFLLSRPHYG